eukprot:Blabericola_migrator_1__6046@NODE_3047_length_2088_cov_62_903513_g1902_i0_p1_GENE_NODE_3047_length_2088_cov_62_903513_g1902_i0NODE_3047_length_2088_cov_62_903513_g1902_i0_p1_ORF_typecomplete_len369_score38_58_NODE_3047_length_2088_cov_62_903513_g1902_i08541960
MEPQVSGADFVVKNEYSSEVTVHEAQQVSERELDWDDVDFLMAMRGAAFFLLQMPVCLAGALCLYFNPRHWQAIMNCIFSSLCFVFGLAPPRSIASRIFQISLIPSIVFIALTLDHVFKTTPESGGAISKSFLFSALLIHVAIGLGSLSGKSFSKLEDAIREFRMGKDPTRPLGRFMQHDEAGNFQEDNYASYIVIGSISTAFLILSMTFMATILALSVDCPLWLPTATLTGDAFSGFAWVTDLRQAYTGEILGKDLEIYLLTLLSVGPTFAFTIALAVHCGLRTPWNVNKYAAAVLDEIPGFTSDDDIAKNQRYKAPAIMAIIGVVLMLPIVVASFAATFGKKSKITWIARIVMHGFTAFCGVIPLT